ncbi:MAG: Minf_1886 family protein [bacterium]
MNISSDILNDINRIIRERDNRYKAQAYLFVLGSLDYTIKEVGQRRHVTGSELSHGIKHFALDQFGPTAGLVLKHWGLKVTRDFGNIVFNLIDIGLMHKTDTDRVEDFENVFDFSQAFPTRIYFNPKEFNPD